MKRIVLCCDGTWNTPDQTTDGKACQTNVTKVASAVADVDPSGVEQLVFYQPGVGTSPGERLRGGAFGMGLSRSVQQVYRFIASNYEPGDELFLFGFSRGAYMARSTAGLIRNAGILRRENLDQVEPAYDLYRDRVIRPRDVESQLFRRSFSHPDAQIAFIGVWDTVGALGIPWSGIPAIDRLNRRWAFHDTRLSSSVKAAFQALAIDEARKPFEPAVWQQKPGAADQRLEQVWFAGVHCDVGGGYPQTGLADIALRWMVDRARSCGLAFREGAFTGVDGAAEGSAAFAPDPLGTLHDSRTGLYRWLPAAHRRIGQSAAGQESVASTALERVSADSSYDPENLREALAAPHRIMPV
jgi:uncharacterized protein (DUF2235 family)